MMTSIPSRFASVQIPRIFRNHTAIVYVALVEVPNCGFTSKQIIVDSTFTAWYKTNYLFKAEIRQICRGASH